MEACMCITPLRNPVARSSTDRFFTSCDVRLEHERVSQASMLAAQACVVGPAAGARWCALRQGRCFPGIHIAGELRLTLQEEPFVREVHHLSMNAHRMFNESIPYHTQKKNCDCVFHGGSGCGQRIRSKFDRNQQYYSVSRAGFTRRVYCHPKQTRALTITYYCDHCQSFPFSD